jgi:hypothetical protein
MSGYTVNHTVAFKGSPATCQDLSVMTYSQSQTVQLLLKKVKRGSQNFKKGSFIVFTNGKLTSDVLYVLIDFQSFRKEIANR